MVTALILARAGVLFINILDIKDFFKGLDCCSAVLCPAQQHGDIVRQERIQATFKLPFTQSNTISHNVKRFQVEVEKNICFP